MFELYGDQGDFYFTEKAGLGQIMMLCGSVVVPRKVEDELLQKAANEVFRVNDGLRTFFIEKDGKVYQDYKPFAERKFEIKNFKSIDDMNKWCEVYGTVPINLEIHVEGENKSAFDEYAPDAPKELIKNVIAHNAKMKLTKIKMGLDNREPSVCELILVQLPEGSGAIIKMHHVVSDAWSMMLIANQFLSVLKGEEIKAYSYKEFVENEKKYFESNRYEKDKQFFEEQIKRSAQTSQNYPDPLKTFEAERKSVTVDEELSKKIADYALKHRVSDYSLFLTALNVFSHRQTKLDEFYIGAISANRTGVHEKNTVGLFIHFFPLLMEIHDDQTFAEAVRSGFDQSFSGYRHMKGFYGHGEGNTHFYDLMISYQNATLEADKTAILNTYFCKYVSEISLLSVVNRNNGNAYTLHFDYNVKIPEKEVDRLLDTVIGVLREGLEDDSIKIGDIYR